VLLLYLEDHLDDAAGYNAGAAVVESKLGPHLYRPPGGGSSCVELPLDLTRDDVLQAGRQVIIVSGCGEGQAWPSVAFQWAQHEETRPRGFEGFPGCGPDFDRATYDATLIRYFEDSTALTAGASQFGQASADDGIDPHTARQMALCGVDLLGLDQLVPSDGRLEKLVWSWARGEPRRRRNCAIQRASGRWKAIACEGRYRVVCREDAEWSVTRNPHPVKRAERVCERRGKQHAVPRTGFEGQLLDDELERRGAARALLGYRRINRHWTALDQR
jgi:hypothetical protein